MIEPTSSTSQEQGPQARNRPCSDPLLLSILLLPFLVSPASAHHARHPQVPASAGVECRTLVRFSPHGGVATAIARELSRAKTRIRIAIYGLNHPDLVASLVAAQARGVSVALKLDKLQSSGRGQQTAIARLRAAGISTEISELSRLLHDKFAVIDGQRVITGSFNWTTQAENRHRENVLIFECQDLARLYEEEWLDIEIGTP